MTQPQNSDKSTAKRVASRYMQAMEHDSPEALRKYLQEHPDADKANHHVKKDDDKKKVDNYISDLKERKRKEEGKPKSPVDDYIDKLKDKKKKLEEGDK